MRDLDIVVFGASGFTGRFIARKFASLGQSYALAGRDAARLEKVRGEIAASGLPGPSALIIAEVSDEGSLISMTARARIVVNAVGPFRFYGEPVVRACIASRCDYVDITGEPEFMERIELKYGAAASSAGVIILSAAAFDSIPADYGAAKAAHALRERGFLPTAVIAYLGLHSTGAQVRTPLRSL